MQKTENKQLKNLEADFEILWCGKVQSLTQLRRAKMSQSDIAYLCGRSLKTIQRFENYKSKDPELMFIYNRLLV